MPATSNSVLNSARKRAMRCADDTLGPSTWMACSPSALTKSARILRRRLARRGDPEQGRIASKLIAARRRDHLVGNLREAGRVGDRYGRLPGCAGPRCPAPASGSAGRILRGGFPPPGAAGTASGSSHRNRATSSRSRRGPRCCATRTSMPETTVRARSRTRVMLAGDVVGRIDKAVGHRCRRCRGGWWGRAPAR